MSRNHYRTEGGKQFSLLFSRLFLSFLGLTFTFVAWPSSFPLRDMAFNDSIDLSGPWLFLEDPKDEGAAAGWYNPTWNRSPWRQVSVPGVWGKRRGQVTYPVYSGLGWYAKSVLIPRAWNQRVMIVFLGAMHITDVWVNGQYAGVHRGGYTPFCFDITSMVKSGLKAEIVVRVDNRLSEETIPSKHLGWQSFGGLYREVYLLHRCPVYPDRITTSVKVLENGPAILTVETVVKNESPREYNGILSAQVKTETSLVVSAFKKVYVRPGVLTPASFQLRIENPRLWSPEDPYLYTLNLEWKYDAKQTISFPVGLREFMVKDGFFYLNNRRLWLQGFGQHEEYPEVGPCVTRELQEKELRLIKDVFQCNTLRPGHYPNHPSLYDLCDRLGIIVHSEIPSWQINKAFAESESAWRFWLKPQIEEMINTLRNHPCVAFWGVANEQPGTPIYNQKATELVRSLDKSRLVTIVFASTAELESTSLVDILARNFHYGWYHSKSVYALRENLPLIHKHSQGKPIWVAEQGALATPGKLDGGYGDQSRGSETYQDHVVRFGFQYAATSSEQICGISLWTLSDFHRGDVLCFHGILDERRQPKLLAYTIANLLRGDLRLFICEENALCPADGVWKASLRYFNPRGLNWKNLTATWRILREKTELAKGLIRFDIPGNRQGEIGSISFPLAETTPGVLHTCWVELTDKLGQWLYTNSSPFDVGQPSRPGVLRIQTRAGQQPAENAFLCLGGVTIPVYPYVGTILPLPPGEYPVAIRRTGFPEILRQVKITAGQVTTLELDLSQQTQSRSTPLFGPMFSWSRLAPANGCLETSGEIFLQ
ncbi:MAG: hypothetical protein NC911_09875, partial [Candidatus Omnitrophica bacterium]|nr:hypothetical protein [Candidatus Omnitrophota bacterium]